MALVNDPLKKKITKNNEKVFTHKYKLKVKEMILSNYRNIYLFRKLTGEKRIYIFCIL